jgi:hypothetical protein
MKSEIFEALGKASALFMSQDVKGTEIVMPTEELEKIGNELLAYCYQPWLGLATTGEMLEEIKTRIMVNGGQEYGLDYRTVGPKETPARQAS